MGLSIDDYKALIVQLLPRGAAWNGENLRALVQSFAVECQRIDAQAETFLLESFPQTADQCLVDWERVTGLPDAAFPVVADPSDLAQRRGNVVAKLSAVGGQSKAYFIAVAGRIGYTVPSIDDGFVPFSAGVGYAGMPIYDAWWAYTFVVNVSAIPATEVVSDGGLGAYPLRRYTNARLEAAINALKPAHTTALFVYP